MTEQSEQSGAEQTHLEVGVREELFKVSEYQQRMHELAVADKLWMEPGVADRAAGICERIADELREWRDNAHWMAWNLPFGENLDGHNTREAYEHAVERIKARVDEARRVYLRMADTYRAAGRTTEEADQAAKRGLTAADGQA